MPALFSLTMPARVYDIPIINEEISKKVEEINTLKELITSLSRQIEDAIEILQQYNADLLIMYLKEEEQTKQPN